MVNFLGNQVYEWAVVVFFKGQVYDWGWFQNRLARTPVSILPRDTCADPEMFVIQKVSSSDFFFLSVINLFTGGKRGSSCCSVWPGRVFHNHLAL